MPPVAPRFCGDAKSRSRSTAAVPTRKFSSFPDAPPENAVIVGVAGVLGVLAEVDPCSITVATISIEPVDGTVVAVANSVMTLPVGASRGTLSQETEASMADRHAKPTRKLHGRRALRRAVCASIGQPKHNSLMGLHGQHSPGDFLPRNPLTPGLAGARAPLRSGGARRW